MNDITELYIITKGGYVYSRAYVNSFSHIFQGLCLFKGLRLFRTLEYVCIFFSFSSHLILLLSLGSGFELFQSQVPSPQIHFLSRHCGLGHS